jgi:hypothetical protein
MMLSEKFFRLSALAAFVIILLVLLFGYLFFEPFLTEETITIKVINKAKFGNEVGKYFVFAPDEVFLNADNYYQSKDNADQLDKLIYSGNEIKAKVVGVYLPWLPRFRNITKVLEVNGVPVAREPVKLD